MYCIQASLLWKLHHTSHPLTSPASHILILPAGALRHTKAHDAARQQRSQPLPLLHHSSTPLTAVPQPQPPELSQAAN
jgi:hypothetical protein